MKTKLHEVLAVESSLEKAANKLIKESQHTLGKESLFSGQVRRLEMFRDEDKNSETTEHQELTTTVDENIDYLTSPISNWLDVVLQKEEANQRAVGELKINDVAFGIFPATFLLGLETKLVKIRSVYESIPTLAPGIKWNTDTQNRAGVFVTEHDEIQMKTRKDPEFREVAPATKEHKAQIAQVERVADVGRYVTTKYSGKMTPLEKANRLSRIDIVLQAVKKARMQANMVDVQTDLRVGEYLLSFINNG